MSILATAIISGAARHVPDMSWHSPVQTWTTFNMVTAHSITDSLNTSSITDGGVGIFSLFWTIPYDNAFYVTGTHARENDNVLNNWHVAAYANHQKNTGDWTASVNDSVANNNDSPEVTTSHSGDMTYGEAP